MTTEHWERVQHLFVLAMAQPDEERVAFIEVACADEPALRDELLAMLAPDRSVDDKILPSAWLVALEGPAPPLFVSGDMVASRYEIRGLLGRGGMGDVYEAWDGELSIPVALKTLKVIAGGNRAQRLKVEGLLARSISHPNVCRVYDLGQHGQGNATVWFLTMEVLRGQTLSECLREAGRLPLDRALRLATQMAEGLGAAHRSGVVHRDFKSQNVMLVGEIGEEQAVITDFGIARSESLPATDGDGSLAIMGTPAYMAPEQWDGGEVGPAADIYALGMVLYEMVAGRLPYPDSGIALARRHVSDPPPSPRTIISDIDDRWEAVILRCLEHEPSRRFGRAEDVTRALTEQLPADGVEPPGLMIPARHGLPPERDAFVGREGEIVELAANLDGPVRLVTLLGAGGMGKTRLSVRYGWQHLDRWPGGIWFCDLTEAKGVDAIASALAGALGVPLGKGDPLEQLGNAIAGRGRCLIVLDNFEQIVMHAEATVGRWMKRAGEARFLVTSRERLDIGEQVQVVDSLSADVGLELLGIRAHWLCPGLELRGVELESAREIVQLVDGMPLAIELAAARMRVMTATQIVQQMRSRFHLLTGGPSARHETLAVTIDGSWELLRPWEQSAWAQCAVFEGGFTLEAAEGVLELGKWPEAPWVVDVVQSLVDKCVLRMWVPEPAVRGEGPVPRFGMYVSVQEYARARLGEMGAEAKQSAELRHGRWYGGYGTDEALADLELHGGISRRRELERELENLVAACRRAVTRGDGATAAAAYGAGAAVLTLRGPLRKAVTLGRSVLEVELGRNERAHALQRLGKAERGVGQMEEARAHYEAALAIHREVGNRRSEGNLLGNLGSLHQEQGRMEEARAHCEAALAIHREVGNRLSEGIALSNLSTLHLQQGRMEETRAYSEAALAIHRELGDRLTEGNTLCVLGIVHLNQGRMEEARAHFESALAIHRELGNRGSEGVILGNLGGLHCHQGRMEEARAHYEAELAIQRELGNRRSEGVTLGNLGIMYRDQGRMDEARAHFEAGLAIHRELGNRRSEGHVLGNLGQLQRDQDRMEEARANYEAALGIHRETDDLHNESIVLGRLGDLHRRQGRIEESRDAIERAETMLREMGDPIELAAVLCARAKLEQRTGNVAAARAALEEAQQLAEKAGVGPESELRRLLANARHA